MHESTIQNRATRSVMQPSVTETMPLIPRHAVRQNHGISDVANPQVVESGQNCGE